MCTFLISTKFSSSIYWQLTFIRPRKKCIYTIEEKTLFKIQMRLIEVWDQIFSKGSKRSISLFFLFCVQVLFVFPSPLEEYEWWNPFKDKTFPKLWVRCSWKTCSRCLSSLALVFGLQSLLMMYILLHCCLCSANTWADIAPRCNKSVCAFLKCEA